MKDIGACGFIHPLACAGGCFVEESSTERMERLLPWSHDKNCGVWDQGCVLNAVHRKCFCARAPAPISKLATRCGTWLEEGESRSTDINQSHGRSKTALKVSIAVSQRPDPKIFGLLLEIPQMSKMVFETRYSSPMTWKVPRTTQPRTNTIAQHTTPSLQHTTSVTILAQDEFVECSGLREFRMTIV